MKIRTDFVTNSSSSSFIVGFKDEDSIESQLKKEAIALPRLDTILNDVKKNRISKAEAIHLFEEEMFWVALWYLEDKYERKFIHSDENLNDWLENHENREEFYQKVLEKRNLWLNKFKDTIKGLDYIALLNYDDHCNDDLEQRIMPKLDCTIQRFSHH